MYGVNEILTMKKPHPCGGKDWEIVRVGVDIKIRCLTCGKFVNLTRGELEKRVKSVKKEEHNG